MKPRLYITLSVGTYFTSRWGCILSVKAISWRRETYWSSVSRYSAPSCSFQGRTTIDIAHGARKPHCSALIWSRTQLKCSRNTLYCIHGAHLSFPSRKCSLQDVKVTFGGNEEDESGFKAIAQELMGAQVEFLYV